MKSWIVPNAEESPEVDSNGATCRAKRIFRGLALAGLLGLIGFGTLTPLPHVLTVTRLARILDFGHFVAFALLTLALWWALGRRSVVAFGVAVAFGAITEAAQNWSGRTANVDDFLRDLLGCLAGLACILALQRPRSLAKASLAAVVLLGVSAWPIAETLPVVLDVYDEGTSFPVLCDFEGPWQSTRWLTAGLELRQSRGESGNGVARIDYLSALRPNPPNVLVLFPVLGDWSGYDRICCEFSCDRPTTVAARLITGRQGGKTGRSIAPQSFPAGSHRAELPLPKPGPRADLTEIHSLFLYFSQPNRPYTIVFDRLYLE